MYTFTAKEYGRIVVMHLGKGELVLESIQKEIDRLGIKNGVVLSAIGSLRKAAIHVITNTEDLSVNKYFTIEKPIELASAQGIIIDGEPHLHLTISEPDGMYAGHMENGCEVQYLAEVSIMEILDLNVTRKPDEYGISYIAEK